MTLKKFSELRDALPEEIKANAKNKADAMRLVMRVDAVRRQRHIAQKTLAAAMGISQPSLSKMEKQDDFYLRSLNKIVTGMGGKLDIAVTFPDGISYKIFESRPAQDAPVRS